MTFRRSLRLAAVLAALAFSSGTALAAVPCRTSGPFERWLEGFKQEALAKGVSRNALAQAAPYLVYDQRIINIDRGQRVFSQTFTEFAGRMVSAGRVSQGKAHLKKHAAVFARAEQQYGVPPAVIAGFWGLESDFGAFMGKENAIRSITSLAYDCRRAEMFRGHLIDALRLIDRGDLAPTEMIGAWAGELGQTQMMPSEYMKFAVDYDGDGHRNLLRSPADVIGSSANYLAHLGWKRGAPWLQEVRVPQTLPWKESGLDVKHPRGQWAKWGVVLADGRALPNDALPASLLLPMGRHGPAFLVYDNFQVYLTWNNSLIYSATAAYYATRIAGAGPMRKPTAPIAPVTMEMTRELQQILTRLGHDVGGVDGKLGMGTRQAVKTMQVKLGLPADSYPTPELLERLRQTR
ncbi:MAG TPA: lytic murein transglycosylase [Xanthobacteraceae bacterium]|nr:lytic murein transglycosylase [Xanthobacteraceae bacterium]